jgi:hypothetical protein
MAVDQRPFGNVIDINGTEVNVEDKRLAELAGQTPKSSSQISTSSQYVPLQDTDGNIVKISPASFQEAVRNTLASLLVNNDKGTSFSQVPVIGSGDFGSASLANLASVLGGIAHYQSLSSSDDLNALPYTNSSKFYIALYTWAATAPQNAPTIGSYTQYQIMIEASVFVSSDSKQRKVQLVFDYGGTGCRFRTCDDTTWHSWVSLT